MYFFYLCEKNYTVFVSNCVFSQNFLWNFENPSALLESMQKSNRHAKFHGKQRSGRQRMAYKLQDNFCTHWSKSRQLRKKWDRGTRGSIELADLKSIYLFPNNTVTRGPLPHNSQPIWPSWSAMWAHGLTTVEVTCGMGWHVDPYVTCHVASHITSNY